MFTLKLMYKMYSTISVSRGNVIKLIKTYVLFDVNSDFRIVLRLKV